MKHGIELNGVANIKMMIDICKMNGEVTMQDLSKIEDQADTLIVYLKAFLTAVNDETEVPKWHEIKELLNKEQN